MRFRGSKPARSFWLDWVHERRFDPGAAFSAGFALAKRLAGKRREAWRLFCLPADDRR